MSRSKKLLIRLSSAGDVLLTSPLLRLIKENEPESEIHFVVKSSYSDLIRCNPNVSSVHLVQDHSNAYHLENLRRSLIHEAFDVTLDLHNNFRSIYLRKNTAREIKVIKKDILMRAVLVKARVNLYTGVKSAALKYAQTYDRSITHVPVPEIFFPRGVEERAAEILNTFAVGNGQAVFLCPGAKHFTKRWPVEYWSLLAKKISSFSTVILLGGKADTEACARIRRSSDAIDFSGKLSLIESAAVLKHASVVVTNDSFLMHAANALGKKIVAIFGSSVREFGFYPYGVENRILEVKGLKCRPCSHIGRESCPKGHFKCMVETHPDMVLESLKVLLDS